jgi:SAM-dependent MidA family methyltransferase
MLMRGSSAVLIGRNVIRAQRLSCRYTSEFEKGDDSFIELKIDRSGLGGGYDGVLQSPALTPEDIKKYKEPLTPLGKELQSYINNRGPMSLNEFMTQALTHNQHGYYQNKLNNSNKIGSSGDFITSPEISSLFGEMITVWCVSMWENMNRPAQFKLVECGPGNGTLMKQILSVSSRRFPAFHAAARVNLVEVSDEMQRIQFEELGCTRVEVEVPKKAVSEVAAVQADGRVADSGAAVKNNNSYRSTTRAGVAVERDEHVPRRAPGSRNQAIPKDSGDGGGAGLSAAAKRVSVEAITADGVPVTWYKQFFQVADGTGGEKGGGDNQAQLPLLAIGQEFLDTFPVYQFIHTSGGWREKLVDVDTSPHSPYHFRVVLASKPTPASHLLLGGDSASSPAAGAKLGQELDLSRLVSEKSLLHGLLRVRGDRSLDLGDAGTEASAATATATATDADEGAAVATAAPSADRTLSAVDSVGIEVSPMALGMCESVTQYIRAHGGAALFIDYGEDYTQADSLRGFLKHKQVNFLSSVGHVDISSDVDFYACSAAVRRTQANLAGGIGVEVDGEDQAGAAAADRVITPPGAGTIILDTAGNSMQVDMSRPAASGKAGAARDAAADRSVLVSDVVTQSDFLLRMGIIERVQQLLEYEAPTGGVQQMSGDVMQELTDEEANNLVNGMKMLVSPTEMGHRFKSICICHRDILDNSQSKAAGPVPGVEFPNMPAFFSFS